MAQNNIFESDSNSSINSFESELFVSGEDEEYEEDEEAAESYEDENEYGIPIVHAFSSEEIVRPIARLTTDDENYNVIRVRDDVVGSESEGELDLYREYFWGAGKRLRVAGVDVGDGLELGGNKVDGGSSDVDGAGNDIVLGSPGLDFGDGVDNVTEVVREGVDLGVGTNRVECEVGEMYGVKVTSVGDSVVDDVNVDLLGLGAAIARNVEDSRGSDDVDKDVSVGETDIVNVSNQFSKISNHVAEEPLELKSEGGVPVSAKSDGNAELGLCGQKSGTAGLLNEDANEVCKYAYPVEGQLEDVIVIDEKVGVASSHIKNMKQEPLSEIDLNEMEQREFRPDFKHDKQYSEEVQGKGVEIDVGRILDYELSEFANQRFVIPDVEYIEKQYSTEFEAKGPKTNVSRDSEDELTELSKQRKFRSDIEHIEKHHLEDLEAIGAKADELSKQRAIRSDVEHIKNHYSEEVEAKGPKIDVSRNTEDELFGFSEQREVKPDAEHIEKQYSVEIEANGPGTDEECEGLAFKSSKVAKLFLKELQQGSSFGSHPGVDSSPDRSQNINGAIITDSSEEDDSDEVGNENALFDSTALTALLKAATDQGSNGGTIITQDGARLFSVDRPAGLGFSIQSSRTSSDVTASGDSENNLSEEEKRKFKKLQQIIIKYLRLLSRLGYSPEDPVAGQMLYKLTLIGGKQYGQLFNFESAKTKALQHESDAKDDIDFSLNVLVLGKSGTGKSATINSIIGEDVSRVHAFESATNAVQEIVGTIDGIRIKIVDTPGLRSSALDEDENKRILSSVKKFTKKCPPDIVLYVDRLDYQTKDLNDLPLLRSITNLLGHSIWKNAIITLTHAASAPPDGPSGSPLSYEVFVAQRSHIVQQTIGQVVGDLHIMNASLMNPISLVENHPSYQNKDGQKVLPNGQIWRSQLLLLCYSLKILSEANSISKAQSRVDQKKLFGFRARSPPLPYILSWLLQFRTHPKLPTDQGFENGDYDVDLSNSKDEKQEDEYDQLPLFIPLKKAQLANLSKEQKEAYFEEYDYRMKLFQKKQWQEEFIRNKEIKKRNINGDVYISNGENADQDDVTHATVPVPLPFDCDNLAYRYRILEPTSQLLARPVLDTNGWDHDCGYNGVSVEHSLSIANHYPAALAIQLTKDKGEFSIHFDSSVATKHGEIGSTMAGFDVHHVGKQLGYTVRGETKLKNLKINKTAVGVSVTFLGENMATGYKLEDQVVLGKRLVLVGSTGTVRSLNDAAYGTNLEVQLRDADYPIGQNQSSLGFSVVKWRGDLALGANLQTQFSVGRSSNIAVRMGLNNKHSGQIVIRTSSSDQIQIALVGIIPVVMAVFKMIWG